MEPAGADAAAPWRAAEAQARTHVEGHAADEASDHRRRRIDEHERYEARRRVERVHQEAASFSAAAVASSRLRSTSFIERARSASRATARGFAKTTAHRANGRDRKSTRLNSSHVKISYAAFCLKKKKNTNVMLH